MKKIFFYVVLLGCIPLFHVAQASSVQQELEQLQQKTQQLQTQIKQLHNELAQQQHPVSSTAKTTVVPVHHKQKSAQRSGKTKEYHRSQVSVHALDEHPDSIGFYPTALVADEHVVTYIAGTPVVGSPYLGDRPAFDGSDYLVNIPSINRDIRLMQQRRRLYRTYESMGYPAPYMPIIALSGKVEPEGMLTRSYYNETHSDLSLGSSELNVAAAANDMVEAYMALAYDGAPPQSNGQRISNSRIFLYMGFVNIGNLDKSPFYFTAGQLPVPFGRFASAMVSSTLPSWLGRTQARPFILGYKSQAETGPFVSTYVFRGDTTLGNSGIGGVNTGYVYSVNGFKGEFGASFIGTMADSLGMQRTGSEPGTTFGGFASPFNGSEAVGKIPGVGVHGNIRFNRYNLTAEWVGVTKAFNPYALSFNGHGARPQAGQLEAGATFMAFDKPSSIAVGYQWSKDTLALNMPAKRYAVVANTSIWKDTIESIEYRHDRNFGPEQFANGAAPAGRTNLNTYGTGTSSDSLLFQIGVFF